MKEISNTILAVLLVMAIGVSVIGALSTMTRINEMTKISGFYSLSTTGTSTANATVGATSYINVSDSAIDLGAIQQGAYNDSETKSDFFEIQNDGTTYIRVDAYASGQSKNGMGGFDGILGCAATSPATCLKIKCNNTVAGTNAVCNQTIYKPLNDTADANLALFEFMDNTGSDDKVIIGINATVPEDESSGDKTVTITFAASASRVGT